RLTKAPGSRDGFWDYIALVPVPNTVAASPRLNISLSNGSATLSWTGFGFKLQSKSSLGGGTWSDVPNGDTSPVAVSANTMQFFRLKKQNPKRAREGGKKPRRSFPLSSLCRTENQ